MTISIFECQQYRDFLRSKLGVQKSQDRAAKGRLKDLAEAARCQTSYLSRVLKGDADLSPEQATHLAEHFRFSDEEFEYFLLLVQKSRAGTRRLEQWIDRKLKKLSTESRVLKVRHQVAIDTQLSEKFHALYYSGWMHSAVHVASDIERYQAFESLAKAVDLSLDQLERIVSDLEKMGLVKKTGARSFKTGTGVIHLDRHAPWQLSYQLNWRMMALRSLEKRQAKDLNYTAVISHSKADREKIEELFHVALGELNDIVRASPAEEVSCVNLDFFRPFRD